MNGGAQGRWRGVRCAAVFGVAAVGLAVLAGCGRPRACVEFEAVPRTLGFRSAVIDSGQTVMDWQTRARATMRDVLVLPAPGAAVPPLAVGEETGSAFRGTAVLLHGHGSTAPQMRSYPSPSERLVQAGWRVVVPELRGFGGYPPGVDDHYDYVDTLYVDTYLPLVLSDLQRAIAQETTGRTGPLVLFGHSLGAHLALHLAALDPNIDGVFLSGHFVRSRCLNSSEHHECQHHAKLSATLGTEDLAVLVAPRRLHVFWGEDDFFYTPAAQGLLELTAQFFDQAGAGASFTSTVAPGCDHCIDGEEVVRFFSTF